MSKLVATASRLPGKKHMGHQRTVARRRSPARRGEAANTLPSRGISRAACLEQLLLAFRDIADYDDIHQAAQRLELVQQWIRDEAARAASDPIFADLLSA